MKKYTDSEIAISKKLAFNFTYSLANLLLRRQFKYDRRTRVGNLAAVFIKQMALSDSDRSAILYKKRKRADNRSSKPATSVVKNPLYVDYKNNFATSVCDDRLRFGNRNHWAKTSQDYRVLSVLKRHFYSQKKVQVIG